MSTSRRTFLKSSTFAAASAALGELAGKSKAGAQQPAADNAAPLQETPALFDSPAAAGFTRGIGIYPGDPRQFTGPSLVLDTSNAYRNLALLRPAYHSSSYDYNLTAQLVTDGIKDSVLPTWVVTSVSPGFVLPKDEREFVLDHAPTSVTPVRGPEGWIQVQLGGGEQLPAVDAVAITMVARSYSGHPRSFTLKLLGSADGHVWTQLGTVSNPAAAPLTGYPPDFARPGELFKPEIDFSAPVSLRYYRLVCEGEGDFAIGEIKFFHQKQRVEFGGPYSFTSAWMSAGLDEEWVYVDLGGSFSFDRVKLYWIAPPAAGSLQVSDDAQNWKTVQALPTAAPVHDLRLSGVRARYVRVLLTKPSAPYGYILSEFEVYGRGGFIAQPQAQPQPANGRLDLTGGSWRLQRDSLVSAQPAAIATTGFAADAWLPATVPGTVLASYRNLGAIPDPNYADNQLQISDSYFYADFWYRTEFTAPTTKKGERQWLNFDGLNWKGEIYLNGQHLGAIDGGFMRGRFDVTSLLRPGPSNALAVLVRKNATPGSCKQKTFQSSGKNGGALGLDNPTYHASIGWDWIPTIRGRNTGIWDDVYLTTSGPVLIENPLVTTQLPLPSTQSADVTLSLELANYAAKTVSGNLRVRFGDIQLHDHVSVAAGKRQTVTLNATRFKQLHIENPRLWWPNGYGEPSLYEVEISFEPHGAPADRKIFNTGIRQITRDVVPVENGHALRMFVNGRRFIPRGGNWGFAESMLLYRAREYDAALRYHREMNMNMVRNWVGQIGDDEFYQACDRHGIVVMQDFWLANPWDGPEPSDDNLFMSNARDLVKRIRHHASIGLYCGRNEGYPPVPLRQELPQLVAQLHPGIPYIGSSADDVVSGHGPYMAMPPDFYFKHAASRHFHSEIGMPNIPSLESVSLMMPPAQMWPQGLTWGLHDFCLEGAQGGVTFRGMVDDNYGGATSAADWISLAQFINYSGYKAMFEAQSKHRMGLLIWMSHPCWPSFVWQTYDYYLEPTAAYFGAKQANEPLHIQWNQADDTVEVVNYSAGAVSGLTALVEVINSDGAVKWRTQAALTSAEDSTAAPIRMQYPAGLTPVHFIRLRLSQGGKLLSQNLYWRGAEQGNYRALRDLPMVKLQANTSVQQEGEIWRLSTALHNPGTSAALLVRLKAVGERSGDRILPVIYEDNYFALMPGETRVISSELRQSDTRGEPPAIRVEGFNVAAR